MTAKQKLYYPVWVSTTGPVSLRWGKPCETPDNAMSAGREKVEEGQASLAFVVRFADNEKTPLESYIYPTSARKIIRHWESVWEAIEENEQRK